MTTSEGRRGQICAGPTGAASRSRPASARRRAVAAAVVLGLWLLGAPWPPSLAPAQQPAGSPVPAPGAPAASGAAGAAAPRPGATLTGGAPPAGASAAPAGQAADWPRVIRDGEVTLTLYLPQLDSWDGNRLEAHAAVSIQKTASAPQVFGVVELVVDTQVDKGARQVTLSGLRVARAKFPSTPDQEAPGARLLEKAAASRVRTIELERVEAALAVDEAKTKGESKPFRNRPPRIVFSKVPAMLVLIDGAAMYRPVPSSAYQRVINTRALVLKDGKGTHYLRLFDGWMTAPALPGPWAVATKPPSDLDAVMQAVSKTEAVDLLVGADPKDPKARPSLATGPVPALLVTSEPTELIVTQGEPNYEPIAGTELLYLSNTTANVFKSTADQLAYVLVTGRWFVAQSPAGPWTNVAAADLPSDFAKIPDDSPKENVKASVPGTPQAQEAAIANNVPETAAIKRSEAKLGPVKYDGAPKLQPIEGTSLAYVVNSPIPVIQVSPTSYYALENAVWFQAPSLGGPWTVAVSVPAAIYAIPPSSPLYYVTYVYVYRATPDVVYVGYTPGYYGTYVSDGVVVYGTGYVYPAWVGTVWYGAPVTYGFAVSPTYTPWTGWVMGFGFGWAWGAATAGWGWGCYPWWGPYHGAAVGPYGAAAWGPGGWAATTGNVYHRWGDTTAVTRHSAGYNAWTGNAWAGGAGMSYNSRTGTLAAGQRAAVGNVYTGSYAYGARGTAVNPATGQAVSAGRVTAGNAYTGAAGSAGYIRGDSGGVARVGNDVYATHDGNVYRNTGSGWEQRSGNGWSAASGAPTETLDRQQSYRSAGEARVQQYRSSGYGGGSAGGGFRGGGFRRR